MGDQPILPYGGFRDPDSGFAAGSDTSEERARRDDNDGTTSKRQRQTLAFLSGRGRDGATYREVGARFNWHHGQSSGVLSVLHMDGRIARLAMRRGKCAVYVLPQFVGGRDTQPHGGRQDWKTRAMVAEATVSDLEHLRVLDMRTIDRLDAENRELKEEIADLHRKNLRRALFGESDG